LKAESRPLDDLAQMFGQFGAGTMTSLFIVLAQLCAVVAMFYLGDRLIRLIPDAGLHSLVAVVWMVFCALVMIALLLNMTGLAYPYVRV
jgi:hypothetical protein